MRASKTGGWHNRQRNNKGKAENGVQFVFTAVHSALMGPLVWLLLLLLLLACGA